MNRSRLQPRNLSSKDLESWLSDSIQALPEVLSEKSLKNKKAWKSSKTLQQRNREIRDVITVEVSREEAELAFQWHIKVWSRVILQACENLFPDYRSPEDSHSNTGEVKVTETIDSPIVYSGSSRAIDPNWLMLNRHPEANSLEQRINLALVLCKTNGLSEPPAWFRDLYFFRDYLGQSKKKNLGDSLKTNFKTWLAYKLETAAKTHCGRTRDALASNLGLSPEGIAKRTSKAEKSLNAKFVDTFQPSWADLLAWDIDIPSEYTP